MFTTIWRVKIDAAHHEVNKGILVQKPIPPPVSPAEKHYLTVSGTSSVKTGED